MGIYLNPGAGKFRMALNSEIYVDKSEIIDQLNRMVNTEHRFVCVSRPRRFGKSLTANMISAYYDHTVNSMALFQPLKIAQQRNFSAQMGKYDVIKLNIQDFLSETDSVSALLSRLQQRVIREIKRAYPDVDYFDLTHLADTLSDVYVETGRQFVIILDEWDCLFREYPHDDRAQKLYLDFLRNLMKDREYIALAYMTGILPIKKYGTHSALNMFTEYSMEHPDELASFVGFTEAETRTLCQKYQMDFSECQAWYDGYSFPQCAHIYSPKSVVDAMMHHRFGSYWNKTETYEALQDYIDLNEDGLRDAIIKMMGGGRQKIDTGTFQNDMTTFTSADDVMTLLIHLGYLGYDIDSEEVFIPNNEVMREYVNATKKGQEWEVISRSIQASDELLQAVWHQDKEKVAAGVERAHLETSHLQYNDENALSYTLSLAFYSARRYYNIVREMPAGKGFADLTFIPRPQHAEKPAIIIELKWNKDAGTAIQQIHEKNYAGALQSYAGKVLLVGINYDKRTKQHTCQIEEYQQRS